jgi:hypothetical protein
MELCSQKTNRFQRSVWLGVKIKPDDRDGFGASAALAVRGWVATSEFMRDCSVIQPLAASAERRRDSSVSLW